MKKLIKTTLRIITVFIPKARLAKMASSIAILAVESLVANTKTKVDDKALKIVKQAISQ